MNVQPAFQGEVMLAVTSAERFRHWKTGSGSFISWQAMRQRCNDPKRGNYKYYGGRGIKVCERWASFKNFYEDMGDRPEGHSLERRDPNGDYEPANCCWLPKISQAANRRFNHQISYQGEVLTLAELARRMNVPRARLLKRLKLGWSHDEMIQGYRNER